MSLGHEPSATRPSKPFIREATAVLELAEAGDQGDGEAQSPLPGLDGWTRRSPVKAKNVGRKRTTTKS
jgi:hypothetical protein